MQNELILLGEKNNLNIQITSSEKKEATISILDDKLLNQEISNVTKYIVKALANNKSTTIETENINDSKKIIEMLKKNLTTIDTESDDSLAKENVSCNTINNQEINLKEIKDSLFNISKIKDDDKAIKSISLDFLFSNEKRTIKNKDVYLTDFSTTYSLYAQLVVESNGITKSAYLVNYSSKKDIKNFKNSVISKIKDLKIKINSQSCKTDKYNIVLSNDCTSDLLSQYKRIFFAEEISKKISPLINKLDKKIFSDNLTIVEDPLNASFTGYALFDSEGTKTQYKKIVENGFFKNKFYNNKYAKIDNVKSTGNSDDVHNMYIVPDKYNLNDLLETYDNCIYIDRLDGLHVGCNTINGDISLQASGFIIENGKKVKGLEMVIMTTNIFELFTNVVKVGNDLKFSSQNVGAPSLLIKNISISGSN